MAGQVSAEQFGAAELRPSFQPLVELGHPGDNFWRQTVELLEGLAGSDHIGHHSILAVQDTFVKY
jgi:hypothetical protein